MIGLNLSCRACTFLLHASIRETASCVYCFQHSTDTQRPPTSSQRPAKAALPATDGIVKQLLSERNQLKSAMGKLLRQPTLLAGLAAHFAVFVGANVGCG